MTTPTDNAGETRDSTFEDWYEAREGFGFRFERALEHVQPATAEAFEEWLRAAYDAGREHAALTAALPFMMGERDA